MRPNFLLNRRANALRVHLAGDVRLELRQRAVAHVHALGIQTRLVVPTSPK